MSDEGGRTRPFASEMQAGRGRLARSPAVLPGTHTRYTTPEHPLSDLGWLGLGGQLGEGSRGGRDDCIPVSAFSGTNIAQLGAGRGDHRRRRLEAYMASAVKRYASPLTSCFVSIGSLQGGRRGVSALWESSRVGRQGWDPKVFRPSRPPSRPGVMKHDRPKVRGAGAE